jgi:hypothetical protein
MGVLQNTALCQQQENNKADVPLLPVGIAARRLTD